jgi:hypothetical protein
VVYVTAHRKAHPANSRWSSPGSWACR